MEVMSDEVARNMSVSECQSEASARLGDVETGSLLGEDRSLPVAVYFPELVQREKAQCRKLRLLHPDGSLYRAWRCVILILTAWSAYWAPLEVGFLPSPSPTIMYLDFAVDLVFFLDMLLVFTLAHRCAISHRLTTDRKAIAVRYLRNGFVPDLLSSVPYNLISFWASGSPIGGVGGWLVRLLACLRLHRLPRVYTSVSVLGQKNYTAFIIIRMSKLMVNIFLASHYAAVIYFSITTLESDPSKTWIVQALGNDWQTQPVFLQYVATMWWSVFVITSIGPAYTSTTTVEQIFSCFYALFGMASLAYTLGTLTVLMVKASSATLEYHEDLEALRTFTMRNSLPPDLEQQLREQLHLRLLQRKTETESFFANVPRHLRMSIMRHLHLDMVEGLPDFQGCSRAFLSQLVAALETEVVMRNAVVAVAGDVASQLYIVLSGKLVRQGVAPHISTTVRSVILPGTVFGKTAVLRDVPQLFTVRAMETSVLLRLSKTDLKAIMAAYPDDAQVIMRWLDKKKENCEPEERLNLGESSAARRKSESASGSGQRLQEQNQGSSKQGFSVSGRNRDLTR